MSFLKIKVIHPALHGVYEAYAYKHEGDCGVDLVCPERVVVPPGGVVKIDLGIQTEMRDAQGNRQSFYLHPRSSMSKTPLSLANSAGVIDASYRGNLKAVVRHHIGLQDIGILLQQKDEDGKDMWTVAPTPGKEVKPYIIEKGTSLFQICCPNLAPIHVMEVDTLTESTRGAGGFGSTGTKVDLGSEAGGGEVELESKEPNAATQ